MRKKVLFLITKSNWGGAQRYVYDLATNLPKEKFEIVVAAGGNGPLIQNLHSAGVRVISIPSLIRDVSVAKEIKALAEISDIIKEEEPDILHINSSKAGAFGALLGRLYHVPKIIFTAHGWAFNEKRPTWQKIILKSIHWLTVLLSHQTIAVSKEVKRQMNWPFTQSKMVVIYNGRDIKNLYPKIEAREFLINKNPQLERYKDDFWSLTIAELHPIKRHDAVVQSMKEIVRLSPNTRHLIIGTGQEEGRLKKLIKENELDDHIFLLGQIKDAAKYLKAADVFILASRSEALPYVIIEACMAGVAIVATSVGGIPEIIENEKSGLLIKPLNNHELKKAVLRLRTDEDLKKRISAEAAVRSDLFTLSNCLEKSINLYNSASTN